MILPDADFWNEGQSAFLREHWHQDDEWIVIIDKLNQLLHVESDKKALKAIKVSLYKRHNKT